MAKFYLSFLLISCLILVNASVIPNHINNIGLSHNAINPLAIGVPNLGNQGNAIQAGIDEKEREASVLNNCITKCKDQKASPHISFICKYECERHHYKRVDQKSYDGCLRSCDLIAKGDPQSPYACECRQTCEKSHPKVFVL